MASNIRSVLEYVPYFRGRLFVVHIDGALLGADELVDSLLDADALHETGVRLLLVAEGADAAPLARLADTCEMHAAVVEHPLAVGAPALERVREIIDRRQVAIAASGAPGRFDVGSVLAAVELGASNHI